MITDVNILVGGAAGQGVDTVMNLLGKTLTREGYYLILSKDYMSRVRGGHNFSRLRIAAAPPWSFAETTDILLSLNEETYFLHRDSLESGGKVIFDPGRFLPPHGEHRGVPVELHQLAREAGNAVTANTVAVGALLVLLGLDTGTAGQILQEIFAGKDNIIKQNLDALNKGYSAAARVCRACIPMPPPGARGGRLFLDGNQLLGLSALASGCRFLSAYPMTPSTGIMTYLAGKSVSNELIVEQAEDEIAAINMALGASFAGARAMTVTSGGGFSLMVEGLSLAGMTETPLVIVVAMRPGPATGLPTRTEQGDLEFIVHAGHGEFPRAVLSATSHEDAFYRLNKAFELADKYQLPVLFLSDQNFADTCRAVEPFDFGKLGYNRHIVGSTELQRPYRRYLYSANGVSPRVLPGMFPGEIVLVDSDEHDQCGHIIEDAATRKMMTEKRISKLTALASEMDEPELYGNPGAEIFLLGWGSTYGALREAVDQLSSSGIEVALLHFSDLWPLPSKTLVELLTKAKYSFCVENNATGQLASLIRRQTGLKVSHKVSKYDGRPFMPGEIEQEVRRHL